MKEVTFPKLGLTYPIALAVVFLTCTLAAFQLSGRQTAYAAQAAAPLDVVISEIAWMGTAVSANDEWIELYNNTGSPVDLTGWMLVAADSTPSIALNGSIPAHSFFLLERTDDSTVPGVAADLLYTGALGNDGEDLVLRDGASAVVDRVDSSAGWFSGHVDGRVPMVRVDTTLDGSQANNWDYNPRCGSATNAAGVSRTCTLTVTAVGQPLTYSVFFNDLATTAVMTTTAVTEMESALLSLIDNAATSLDIALYGLNRQSVVDALITAHGRGVALRVVGDDDAAVGEYSVWYQALADAGITVVTDTSASKIQHNKFLIVDDAVVWTGSTNFTDTGLTMNANNPYIKLIYMNARWYDGTIGRFISPDTIVPDPTNPQSLNRYSYTNNNPVNYVDPSGHAAQFFEGGNGNCQNPLDCYYPENHANAGEIILTNPEEIAANRGKALNGVAMLPYVDTADDVATLLTGCGIACQAGYEQPLGWGWRTVAGVGIIAPLGVRSVRTAVGWVDDAVEEIPDLFAFGNKTRPRPPRAGIDIFPDASGMIPSQSPPLPRGASTFADVSQAPLTGQYHRLPAGTQMPEGLAVAADGIDVIQGSPNPPTHHTIYPSRPMHFDEFTQLFSNLPWEYAGKK